MAEEVVTILRVGTEEAVRSVNDLRENIKILKSNLGELTIGSQEYQDTLEELKVNQNALKDAMYATTGSMEDVAAAATGMSKSYNSLVHQMAALKEEWRATNDEARRNELGKQIAEINQELKDMDASVGNFSRNVGNYESGVTPLVAKFEEFGGFLKNLPPTIGPAKEQIGKFGETLQLAGKSPILTILGLLAPMIIRITESLKGNATAMDAVKKIMDALKPVMDFFSGLLERVAQGLSDMVDWVLKLAGQGAFDGFISKIAGVGNAILQYMLAPIKSAIAAVKGMGKIIGDVFKGNWSDIKTHAKETGQEIADAYKEGFSFKANFQEGKAAGTKFIQGTRAKAVKNEAKAAGEEIGKEMAKGVEEGLQLADVEKALAKGDSRLKAKFDAEKAEISAMDDWWAEEMASVDEDINTMFEENLDRLAEQTKVKGKMTAEEIVGVSMDVANATSGLMSALADMYESDEKNAEKNAKKIKALRIASATIDMLNGAVAAFASAQQLPPPFGQIVGAANAAAVIAMGVANINKIKSTNPTGGGTATASAPTPASVSAPNIDTGLQSVRNVTSASEEDRLNRMAKEQRVYILQSDIEAAGEQSKVQVAESSF
jgi:predicted  nucleic acid-binding Zn-ribbon protein